MEDEGGVYSNHELSDSIGKDIEVIEESITRIDDKRDNNLRSQDASEVLIHVFFCCEIQPFIKNHDQPTTLKSIK